MASKEANEKVDHENMVTIDYRQPRTFRVVSKSWVPVRIKPKLDAHAIGGKQCDEIIRGRCEKRRLGQTKFKRFSSWVF